MARLKHPVRKPVSEEVLEAIEKALDARTLDRLGAYAAAIARTMYWRGERGGEVLPGGESPESVVVRAVEKLIDGRNVWPRERVSLTTFLKQNIRRELHHLANSKENKAAREMEHEDEAAVADPRLEPGAETWLEEFLEFLASRGDEQLRAIVPMILDGLSPRGIAGALRVQPNEIYNARKRLKRLMLEFQKKRKECS